MASSSSSEYMSYKSGPNADSLIIPSETAARAADIGMLIFVDRGAIVPEPPLPSPPAAAALVMAADGGGAEFP